MKFKLGQKVNYKNILRKTSNYLHVKDDDFIPDETKEIKNIKRVTLNEKRIGYVMGTRYRKFKTFISVFDDGDFGQSYIAASGREMKQVYLVAYTMGKTDYVLEEDLKEVNLNA